MKASSGTAKNGYLGFGCPLWPCEKSQGCQVMRLSQEDGAGNLYHWAAGGAVSFLNGCVSD